MLTRIRNALEDEHQGFTLIELLVVVLIIGILAAIAIPVFLNQRHKAVDASIKADLRATATAVETYYVDHQAYPAGNTSWATGTHLIGAETLFISPGNTVNYVDPTAYGIPGAYCLYASNTDGSQTFVFMSDRGYLQPASVTSC